MKKELDIFYIDGHIGFNQDDFKDWWMKKGGCGAVTACDCCIYFARKFGLDDLYPYAPEQISKDEYIDFAMKMKPFLSPRINGIDTLELFIDGFGDYLKSVGNDKIKMTPVYSSLDYSEYAREVKRLLNADLPVPMLVLRHKSPMIKDFVWHWFWLAGYEEFDGEIMVKLITYGTYFWLPLKELWNSGYAKKGGIVAFDEIEGK